MRNRGILDIDGFINPKYSDMLSSAYFENIGRAKDIILDTIKNDGTFLIYADVDVDGCTSASIAYRYLKNYTNKIKTFINKEKDHGIQNYFNLEEELKEVDTVIIVDSINDSPDKYLQILDMGKQLVIADHHIPNEEILKVKDKICLVSSAVNYPNSHLSGSGVTWKLMRYIDECTENNYANLLVDLAACGIISDVCDVGKDSPENRYICYMGFNNIYNPALKIIAGNYEFNSTTISYSLSPLVNSANRVGNNKEALELFISDDITRIKDIIDNLKSYKDYQKEQVDTIYSDVIINQAQGQLDKKCMYFLISDAKNFAGLIANKACADFNRPVIVLQDYGDNYSGSMRSVGVDNFQKIISDSNYAICAGHEMAAGITIPKNNFFLLYNYIEEQLKDYSFKQEISVDVELSVNQINSYLIKQLKLINKISGKGFPAVIVKLSDVSDYKINKMSNGKHLSLKTNDVSFIKWNFSDWNSVLPDAKLSAIGTLDENFFAGKHSYQLIMDDFVFT